MSTAKHTPGPWFVPTPARDAFGDYRIQSGKEGGYGVIATTNPAGIECPEANARLIAAAPALLEACKRLLMSHTNIDSYEDAAEHARSAIKQAEGEL